MLLGAAAMIEMVYHLQLNQALGPKLKFMGARSNAKDADAWFGAVFVRGDRARPSSSSSRRHFVREWGEVQGEIEREIKRGRPT